MSSVDDDSGGQRVGSPIQPPALDGKAHPLTATELEQLRERVAETRLRTMELMSRYLASSARSAALIARSRETATRRDEERAALSASVARYAILLRTLGEPPERTLILIKAAFNEAAPVHDADHRAVLDELVKWIVEAYYAA